MLSDKLGSKYMKLKVTKEGVGEDEDAGASSILVNISDLS